jgi:hypothetical protein
MTCFTCGHPEWEHVEESCEHKYIDDPRDASHLCDCVKYIARDSIPKTTKIVTMVIEVRTIYNSELVAEAMSDYLKSKPFRDGLSGLLRDEFGPDCELVDGGTVEVEEENSG